MHELEAICGLILLTTLLGAWFVSADISSYLCALRIAMERLAKGDLPVEAPGTDRRDEVGGMAVAVGVFQTHMFKLEIVLAERTLSEQRLRDYVATASDWHWETDADFRFTMISPQAREHGIDPESAIGLDRLNKDDADDVVAAYRVILARREPFNDLRHDYPTERGSLTLSLSGLPVIGDDAVFLGYRGSARDITAQMRADAMQRTARWSAEQANRAKSNFLANVSHEIRTPMNGVLGMVQLLSQTALDIDQRQMCDTIFRSGKSLLQILNDILDYSKLAAHKIELELVGCQLTDIVYDVAALMYGTAEAKGLSIEVLSTDNTWTTVAVDPTRLRRVLINLVSNAIKFSEHGTISMGLHTGLVDPGHLAVTLTVADQGIGISPEGRRHLFQRFSQADTSITRRFGGTGLGLAITRELVSLMGGDITVASVPGEGSTFTVSLTLETTNVAASMAAAPAPSDVHYTVRAMDILAAEDDDINQAAIRGMLTGHRITIAANGEEAVRLAAGGGYDLILMDVMMPIMDGVVATAAIRTLGPPAGDTPIIALTANAVSGDRERYLEAGMNGYVSKPIEQNLLLKAMENVLGIALPRPVIANWRPTGVLKPADTLEVDAFIASIGV